MRRLVLPTILALFAGYGVASAADGAIPVDVDPVLVAIGTGLTGAIGVLWKLHLDDDKRKATDSDGWRTASLDSVAKLTTAVGQIEATLKTEHTMAGKGRDGDERFREYVREEIAEIKARLEARR